MNTVEVPCTCPGSPHAGDTVTLAPVLDVRIGAAAMAAVRETPSSVPDLEGQLSSIFVHYGVRSWTYVDDKGEDLPLSIENIDARLTWATGGLEVAEAANALYAGDLFAPLVQRMQRASPSGPTDDSTSPTPEHGSDTGSSGKPSLHAVTDGRPSGAKAS